MISYKSNRFYFFVAGYTLVFGMLAFFGTMEATRHSVEQDRITKEKEDQVASITGNKALYKMPRIDVTVSALSGGGTHHVRLGISLQMDKNSVDRFIGYQPRVSDRIVTFLDHEDIDKFAGPHGMHNLRRDMLDEVNKASPIVVSDIIFREFVVR